MHPPALSGVQAGVVDALPGDGGADEVGTFRGIVLPGLREVSDIGPGASVRNQEIGHAHGGTAIRLLSG